MPLSVRLQPELDERLTRLARETHRSKSFYVIQALNEQIDRLEYIYSLQRDVEDYRAGKLKTYTAEEMAQRYDLEL